MNDSIQTLEIRLGMLSGDLERARRYGTGLILFVVYRAESVRADLEQQLLDRIAAMGQRVRRVHFHPDDPPEARALMGRLRQEPPAEDEVVFVYGLRHAFPELLNSLNYRREFVPDNKWRLLFWALDDEVARVMRDAPDFWAFVNQTIELPEVPPPAEQARLTRELAWAGFGDDVELRQLSSSERKARIALRERLLAELPDEDNYLTRADLHYTLGGLYSYDGQLATAEQHLQTALELAKQTDNVNARTRALNGLGNVYRDQSRFEEAIATYHQAIELSPKYASPWNGLGNAYASQGRYEDAISAFRQAVGVARALDDRQAQAISLYNEGIALLHLADVEQNQQQAHLRRAADTLEQALGLFDVLEAPALSRASTQYHLGRCYRRLGRWREAITLLEQLRDILSYHKSRPRLSVTLFELGQLYCLTHDFESAYIYLKDALRLFRRMDNADGIAITQEALGNLALQTARPADAVAFFENGQMLPSALVPDEETRDA